MCGSGLGTLAESISQRVIVPYSVLEGFGQSSGASYLALRGLHDFIEDRQSRDIGASLRLGKSGMYR